MRVYYTTGMECRGTVRTNPPTPSTLLSPPLYHVLFFFRLALSQPHTCTELNTRVHIVSSFLSPQAISDGADSFIAKPVSGATLTEAIRDYAVEVADALPVVPDDGDGDQHPQNPQGQTPFEVPPRRLDISADLVSARNEQVDFLFMTAAEFDVFLRAGTEEFEEDMTVIEGAGEAACFTVSDKLFAVHRLKGALYTARLTEMGDLAAQVEAELKEIESRGGGRLRSDGGGAVVELRRRLDRLRQSLW
jgi:HPt (histidine-containing phosphotransfer) domain-containing protein